MRPLTCQRETFDLPPEVSYLNCAYMGPLSGRVVEAGRRGLERKARPWTISAPDFFDPVEEARNLFAQVVGADADGVALLPAVSYGIAVAANNVEMPRGGRVVALAEEFPSNVYAWMDLAERHDGELVMVARPADGDWTDAVMAEIDERTAVVTLPHCHWTDGSLIDLVAIGRRTRDAGAALVIDGTQSVGAMPLAVDEVRPDFLVTAAYKWLLGPYSFAFMWVGPRYRDGRPLELSWISRAQSDDFPQLVRYTSEFRPGARRYDVGETSNFALVPAANAALAQTLEWGVSAINEYTASLTSKLAADVAEIGLSVASPGTRSRHLVGVRLPEVAAEAIASAMASARVYVSVRGDAVRVSPHVYNDEADIDRLVDVLRSL